MSEEEMLSEEEIMLSCCNGCIHEDDHKDCHCLSEYVFIAGLAKGKPKWHDLRKNPDDLPEESGEFWTKWEDGTYCTAHYFADNGFASYIIAWCELPKFEK